MSGCPSGASVPEFSVDSIGSVPTQYGDVSITNETVARFLCRFAFPKQFLVGSMEQKRFGARSFRLMFRGFVSLTELAVTYIFGLIAKRAACFSIRVIMISDCLPSGF